MVETRTTKIMVIQQSLVERKGGCQRKDGRERSKKGGDAREEYRRRELCCVETELGREWIRMKGEQSISQRSESRNVQVGGQRLPGSKSRK